MNFIKKYTVTALSLLIAAGSAVGQVKKRAPLVAANKSSRLPVDKDVIIGKLPNGLTYYIRKNVQPKSRAELYLVNKAGSVLETDDQQGLAHFTEHMAFNGTRDFPKNELVNYLQKAGVKFGADLNAYTSYDETVYQLPLPTDSVKTFEKGFDILADWAGHVSFDPAEIDKERGVVLEEERLRGKNAQERMQHQYLPVVFNNSRYAIRQPIGKEDIIENFKPETIKRFYHDWYRPDLQAVIAVGDFDPKRVEQLIKQNFSDLKNPAGEKPRITYSVPPAKGTIVKFVTDKEYPYTMARIIVKLPGTKIKTEADYLQSVRIDLFNQMLNARLNELTQKADPPFLFGVASYSNFIANLDAFSSVAVAKPGELEKAVKAVIAETERARKFGFTSTEFERAKQDALTQIENAWKEKDKTKSVSFVQEYQQNFLLDEAIPGIDFEYNFYKKNINKISLADINAMAGRFITDQNRAVIIEAPEKDKDKLPSEKTLLEWINTAGKGVSAYVDLVSNKPLLDKEPTGSKVTAEQKDAVVGTTMLTFGNGVKAILKPTDFKNDQILIKGYGFGGTSLAGDEDFTSADLADGVIGSSGIAGFNQITLGKMLSGKNVNISPYITETTEGITGSSSPEDFETALQLVYLYFTQPRKDPDIWQANISQIRSLLANRSLDPVAVYQDTVAAVLSNYNMRRMTVNTNRLNTASLDKAYTFYKDRFADASGFTFIITGSFDAEKIKPVLEKYLGGLPSAHRVENFKNLGIHAPAGQVTKKVYRGIGDKSNVELVFSGDYDYNESNNLQLDALEEVLNIKLIERLREQESGVYAPRVNAGYSKLPAGRYNVTISFTCSPANVDKLIADTMDEIAKLKKDGGQAADIQKFAAEETRSTELQLKDNGFWSSYLLGASQNQQNPDAVMNHIHDLNKVTIQTMKETANKYLSGSNLVTLILYPETKK